MGIQEQLCAKIDNTVHKPCFYIALRILSSPLCLLTRALQAQSLPHLYGQVIQKVLYPSKVCVTYVAIASVRSVRHFAEFLHSSSPSLKGGLAITKSAASSSCSSLRKEPFIVPFYIRAVYLSDGQRSFCQDASCLVCFLPRTPNNAVHKPCNSLCHRHIYLRAGDKLLALHDIPPLPQAMGHIPDHGKAPAFLQVIYNAFRSIERPPFLPSASANCPKSIRDTS